MNSGKQFATQLLFGTSTLEVYYLVISELLHRLKFLESLHYAIIAVPSLIIIVEA
jgi:hypothetical protein